MHWLSANISTLRKLFDKIAGLKVTRGLRTPKRAAVLPDVLTKEECERLLRTAGTVRDQLILGLLYGCGIKSSELCALRWQDVNPDYEPDVIVTEETIKELKRSFGGGV